MSLIKGSDLKGIKLYKFLHIDLIHNGFTYKEGENVDILPFNPKGTYSVGGLYFFDANKIDNNEFVALYIGMFYVADVSVDDDEPIWKEANGRYKTHKFTLKNIRNKIDFELNQEQINMIISKHEWNSDFNVVYHLLHGKEHTKDLIRSVMDIKHVGFYLFIYTKFIDEDLFFELVDLYRDISKINESNIFTHWINHTFKKLIEVSKNPEKLFEKYYDKYGFKEDYIDFHSTDFFNKYWTHDLICKCLQKILKKSSIISKSEAFILLNYQNVIDMEKFVMTNPTIYIYVFNKTKEMTKYILRKKILENYKELYKYIPAELMKNYEIKLELLKNDYPIKDIIEFGKEVIKNGDIKDEIVFDKLMKIKEIKQILIDSLNK